MLFVGEKGHAVAASTKEMMKRLGHSTMNAVLAYLNATDKRAAEIANEIERKLQEPASGSCRG